MITKENAFISSNSHYLFIEEVYGISLENLYVWILGVRENLIHNSLITDFFSINTGSYIQLK